MSLFIGSGKVISHPVDACQLLGYYYKQVFYELSWSGGHLAVGLSYYLALFHLAFLINTWKNSATVGCGLSVRLFRAKPLLELP